MAKGKEGKKRDVVIDMIPPSIPVSADTSADKEAEFIVSFAKVLVPFLGGDGVLSRIVQDPRTPKLLSEFCAFNRARKK